MFPIEKCRKILGKDATDMSDERIKELRDNLYALGEIVLEQYFEDLQKD